jgi:PRTRC genetic system protein B
MAKKTEDKNLLPSPFRKVLPGLGVKKARLLLRLAFYDETIIMEKFDKNSRGFKIVDPRDITAAFEQDYSFTSGFLPPDTLWTSFTKKSQTTALWVKPGIRRLAVKVKEGQIDRYNVPLPGLIFICRPSAPPWVYACPERPAGPRSRVYCAPFANVYANGATCGGNNRYPADIRDIPENFLRSFFSWEGLSGHSRKHPKNVVEMWAELDKKKAKEYPAADLLPHGIVNDLMKMEIN